MSTETSVVTQTHDQLDEVKDIMVLNIEKVIVRGANLDVIQDKAEDLEIGAYRFNSKSRALRKKMWWQDKKMLLILISVITVIVFIIILSVVLASKK